MSSPHKYGMFSEDVLYTSNGIRRTRSLFKETSVAGDKPIFTLGRDKEDKYICLRDLYIKFCTKDPSESIFAETVFGDVGFWNNIAKSPWIQEYLQEWREIAEAKRKAIAFQAIIDEIENGGRSSLTAAKFLIEEPWKDKRNPKVKKDSEKTAESAKSHFHSDFKRLQEEGLIN